MPSLPRLLFLLSAVAAAVGTPPLGPCAVPSLPSSGWQVVGGSRFTIRLPPAYRETPVRDPDVEVGRWSGGTRRLSYEFGSWTNSLTTGAPELDRVACEARIGGHAAKIVTGRGKDGSYFVGGYWAELGRISVGPSSLTIIGTAPDSTGQRELLAALWTVAIGQ